MTYDYKLARASYYRSKRRRRVLGWACWLVLVGVFLAGGIALAASRPLPTGGGGTMPVSVPASPAFMRMIAAAEGYVPKPRLWQNCMGSKCVVYSRDLGTVVKLARHDESWRITSMIGGDSAARGMA